MRVALVCVALVFVFSHESNITCVCAPAGVCFHGVECSLFLSPICVLMRLLTYVCSHMQKLAYSHFFLLLGTVWGLSP